MAVLNNLQPKRVFYYFEELCRIPHGSGNTKEISDYLVTFAKTYHLRFVQDSYNNVVIYKDASKGYEAAPTVILQGHMDMVCEKTPESLHDFSKDPLELFIEGDFLGARNTTLGGDDGIALAFCLAILESDSYVHPPLEVVFTADEEIGLVGAGGLDWSLLTGRLMVSLDSETEGEFVVSCAGGAVSKCQFPVRYQEGVGIACEITITGLLGGHSGAEIHTCRGNAHLLMGRLLHRLGEKTDLKVAEITGGRKDTAIPRNCRVLLLADEEELSWIRVVIKDYCEELVGEYAGIEPDITIILKELSHSTEPVLHPVSLEKIIFFLMNVPNGVQKMSGTLKNLVETSSNLGELSLTPEYFIAVAASRSSVESGRDAVAAKIQYLTEFLGGEYHLSGVYPAWEYQEDSFLQRTMGGIYEKMFCKKPEIKALHAGLECGLFYRGLPGLDCVSIGPNMKQIHTTEERLSISSTERTFQFLLEILRVIK